MAPPLGLPSPSFAVLPRKGPCRCFKSQWSAFGVSACVIHISRHRPVTNRYLTLCAYPCWRDMDGVSCVHKPPNYYLRFSHVPVGIRCFTRMDGAIPTVPHPCRLVGGVTAARDSARSHPTHWRRFHCGTDLWPLECQHRFDVYSYGVTSALLCVTQSLYIMPPFRTPRPAITSSRLASPSMRLGLLLYLVLLSAMAHLCRGCGETFKSSTGLSNHERLCDEAEEWLMEHTQKKRSASASSDPPASK